MAFELFITEPVSFKVAKLAKDAGFNFPTMVVYDGDPDSIHYGHYDSKHTFESWRSDGWQKELREFSFIPAPTLIQIREWLASRGIQVWVFPVLRNNTKKSESPLKGYRGAVVKLNTDKTETLTEIKSQYRRAFNDAILEGLSRIKK